MLKLLLASLLFINLAGCGLFSKPQPPVVQWQKVSCEGAVAPTPLALQPTPMKVAPYPTPEDPKGQALLLSFVSLNNLLSNISKMSAYIEQQQSLTGFYVDCIKQHNSFAAAPPSPAQP